MFFARRGYVYVFQDVRGRHESQGAWDPARYEFADGYDTVEWAAKQPWSNGKVGMQGGSYLGSDQWQTAQLQPPHLTAIFPDVAATSWYHHAFFLNGGFRLSLAFGWGPVRQESHVMQNTGQHTMEGGPEAISYDKVIWHLPLIDMPRLVGRNAKFYRDWIEHPDYDDYWKGVSVEEHFDKMEVPAYNTGGWFDILLQGTLNGYTGPEQARQDRSRAQGYALARWRLGTTGPPASTATWTSARPPTSMKTASSFVGTTTGCTAWTTVSPTNRPSLSSRWGGTAGASTTTSRCPTRGTRNSTSTAAAKPTVIVATAGFRGTSPAQASRLTATATTPTTRSRATAAPTAAARRRPSAPWINAPWRNATTC